MLKTGVLFDVTWDNGLVSLERFHRLYADIPHLINGYCSVEKEPRFDVGELRGRILELYNNEMLPVAVGDD